MKTIEEYAVALAADGAESHAEDDMNEDGEIGLDDHLKACELATSIARAIRMNPDKVLALLSAGPDAASTPNHTADGATQPA